jgi:methyl-accepting chemotaxis protein
MARRTARIARERTLATLVRNLFDLENASNQDRRRIERLVLQANPGLAQPEGFSTGRLVVVPEIEGFSVTARVTIQTSDLAGLLQEARGNLSQTSERIKLALADAEAGFNEARERLGDRGFLRVAVEALPEGRERVRQASDALDEREARTSNRAERLMQAVESTQAEVDRLARRARD